MDRIHYNFIDVEIPDFDPEFFDLWLSNVIVHYKRSIGELSFMFCSDEELLKINLKYLGHDFYTDIVTFNYNEKDSLSGDVFISYDRVKENAVEYGNKKAHDELCRVVVHGVLHLIGFNDKTEEDQNFMREQEDFCLGLR